MNNTFLVQDNYLWYYQIIECSICGKQHVVFRTNNNLNVYLEEKTFQLENEIKNTLLEVSEFYNYVDSYDWFVITSNVQDILDYPIWMDKIFVNTIYNKATWEETIVNDTFKNII